MHYKERQNTLNLKSFIPQTLRKKDNVDTNDDKDSKKDNDKVEHGPKSIVSNGISVAVGDAEIAVDFNDARFTILCIETKLSCVFVKILR